MASQCSEEDVKEYKKLFLELDINGDGSISIDEMKKGIEKYAKGGDTKMVTNIEELMKSIDTDGSGNIDYTEFLAAVMDEKLSNNNKMIEGVFKNIDTDSSGSISIEELCKVLGEEGNIDVDQVKELMNEIDENGDGVISLDEFKKMMRFN